MDHHERSSTHDHTDKLEEVMLPGFRFHPTDEELVGFYLKRKIQQRPLSIELIKQLDIYKYDPWDLPKLASTGEKEWYFYCPRDRKYRNSARPNRVTGAGFWKATGTDRPIYSSEGTKCIGLKKSLVFYKGRAAKGVKTDWMMHEFRLPSLTDHSVPSKRLDKSFPANDSWAICRIFKKTNSTAQRALSHSWVSPLPEPSSSSHDILLAKGTNSSQFSSETISNMSLTPKTSTTASSANHFCSTNNDIQNSSSNATTTATTSTTTFSPIDFVPYGPYHTPINLCTSDFSPNNLIFPPLENTTSKHTSMDNIAPNSMLLNMPSILGNNHFGNSIKASHLQEGMDFGFSTALPYDLVLQGNLRNLMSSTTTNDHHQNHVMIKNHIPSTTVNGSTSSEADHDQWEDVRSLGFPFNFPLPLSLSTAVVDPWKPSMIWDSLPCPTEMSTNFPTNKCYT